jgi:hypothetical protein
MARAFATNQKIEGTTTVGKNQTYFTLACWFRRPSNGTLQICGFSKENHNFYMIHNSNERFYLLISNGSLVYGETAASVTGWNHFAQTFDGSQSGNSNRLKAYVNGANATMSFSGTVPSTTSNSADMETFTIGREIGAFGRSTTGDIAEVGVWQATLTADEIASLADGMTCDKIRPQSLVYYTPLIRDIQDLARGMTLTNTNSTVATHPRVYA